MNQCLKTYFGYETFRPLQQEIIETVLSGQDTVVLMPTGGGKSLCFQLPALLLPGITLVVSPLIALMKDQVDALQANGVGAAYLNSTLSSDEQELVMQQAASGELKLLYVAPERVVTSRFSEFLESVSVSLLAIDEAHCISEWGHDFRPEYRTLRMLRLRLQNVPTIALTATATPLVREDIIKQLGMKKKQLFVSSFDRENLHYHVRPKNDSFKALKKLLDAHKGESAIVYCFSRKNTESTAKKLRAAGVCAAAYHAGLSKKIREKVQNQFIRDEVPVIVATIAFGMGIDKPDVRLVVHMDLPKTVEGYYQETGRAGRDGLPSDCVLFYTYADRRKHEFFIQQIDDVQEQSLALHKLDDVIAYCQNEVCRRFFLLTYFGEQDAAISCQACDNCMTPAREEKDATEISQMILSAILRTGERFGTLHICDVLRGSKKKRVLAFGHDTLSVYGIAKHLSIDLLREYIQLLIKRGYLLLCSDPFPLLRVSQKGKIALKEKSLIHLPLTAFSKKSVTTTAKRNIGGDYDQALFEKLRTVRKQIADEQGVPPFVIFGDKTLQQMASDLPASKEDFLALFGVGEKKLKSYGEIFMACIAAHKESSDFS